MDATTRPARTGLAIAATLLVCGAAAIAIGLRLERTHRTTREDVYTIPPGTSARVARGEPVADVLPQRIKTNVGNALKVVNHDVTNHAFGPFVLAPGQQWSRQFAVQGDYEMTCTIYPDAGFTVDVGPGPTPTGGILVLLNEALRCAWLVLTALVVGSHLAAAATLGGGRAADVAGRWIGLARAATPSIPALAMLAAAATGAALSRVVPWGAALSGTASLDAWFGAVWALGGAVGARRFIRADRTPSGWNLSMWALVLIWPATRALVPEVSPTALLLVLTGGGLLSAVVVAARAWPVAASVDRGVAVWLVACGVTLVVAGTPLGASGVAPRLALGAIDVSLGLGLVIARQRWTVPSVELGRLVQIVSIVAGAAGAFQLALAAVGGVLTPVSG